MLTILDLDPDEPKMLEAAAAVLVAGFQEHYPNSWPTLESAREEVQECLAAGFVRAAIGKDGAVVGWAGGRSEYDGRVYEMHPLVVHPAFQRQGIGRALVADLEQQVSARGGLTIMLGADDEDNQTSLGGIDVYPDVWRHIRDIKNIHRHQFEFYLKQGYVVVGIVPDANGFGKPDIMMAKRVAKQPLSPSF